MAGGRPSKYDKSFNDQVYKLALLGADDKQLAYFFDVDERTINRWKKSEPEFCQSLKEGKDIADSKVSQSLYKRAIGFQTKEEHEISNGDTVTTKVVWKEVPPDTTAAIFWLKNRQSANWRDKQEVEHTGTVFKVTKKNVD